MITVTSATQATTDKAPGVLCQHCGKQVKLNEIVRTATHDLGCKHCYKSR